MAIWSILGALTTVQGGLLLGFPALVSITDPFGNSVVFSQMTADRTHAERMVMARRVALYALIILLVSLWAGSYVLNFFGITLPALKVGGGLVVAATGWRMLYASDAAEDDAPAAAEAQGDMTFFPITMPLVVGPGAISVAIALGATRTAGRFDGAFLAGVSLAAVADVVLVALLFSYADSLSRLLGRAGSRVVKRIVSLFLLTIGVQIMAVGLQDMLLAFLASAGRQN
jgi:multiple antibiotic resistance protein